MLPCFPRVSGCILPTSEIYLRNVPHTYTLSRYVKLRALDMSRKHLCPCHKQGHDVINFKAKESKTSSNSNIWPIPHKESYGVIN